MFRKLLFLPVLFLILNKISAQTNLNLETWGGNNLNPAEWVTLNALSQLGTQTTFKETISPGQGMASAKMVTSYCNLCSAFSVPFDTVGGIIVSGDTATSTFGIPYTQTPQYLSFRYKANPQPGDAGIVAVQLSYYDAINDSTIIIAEGIFLENNVVSNWTDMLLPLQYYTADTPDTILIASSSSASFLFSGSPLLGVKQIGSEFYADTFNLHFTFPCAFSDIALTVFSTNETAPNANDGTATAAASGSFSPITYQWSNAETTDIINNLSPGTYTVTVTDSMGCSAIDSVIVNQYICTLVVNATGTDETAPGANNGTADAGASGGTTPYSYNWSNTEITATINNLSPGNYTVTITDSVGCTAVDSVTVNAYSCSFGANVTATDESGPGANNGTAYVTPSGGTSPYSFNWSNFDITDTITNLAPGTYSVTITDVLGCTAIDSANVNAYVCTLTASATSTAETAPNANDGTATAIPSGGTSPYSYNWSNFSITDTVINLAPGTYSVTITDAVGCSDSATVIVDSFTCAFSATASATAETAIGASDGTATVLPSGGNSPYTYNWSTIPPQDSSTATGLSAGTYFVTVTDSNNCLAYASATVSSPSPCNISITGIAVTEPSCNGDTNGYATITISGGTGTLSVAWSNGNIGNTGYNLFGDSVYSVTVTDVNINNCTADTFISISQPSSLMGTISATDETCSGCNDGTANVTVSGGTPPYSYNWTGGQSSPNVSGLAPGIYSVIVLDSAGCLFTTSDTVLPAVLEVEELVFGNSSLGNIRIFPNPNNGIFTLQIMNDEFRIMNIEPDSYRVRIFNVLGEMVYEYTKPIAIGFKLQTNHFIDLSNKETGIYFINIISSEGTGTGKLIIR